MKNVQYYFVSGHYILTAVTIDETSKKLEKVKSGRPLIVDRIKLSLD
jgi:hypothetical protein